VCEFGNFYLGTYYIERLMECSHVTFTAQSKLKAGELENNTTK